MDNEERVEEPPLRSDPRALNRCQEVPMNSREAQLGTLWVLPRASAGLATLLSAGKDALLDKPNMGFRNKTVRGLYAGSFNYYRP